PFAPIHPVVSKLRAGLRPRVALRRGPDEYIDNVFAAGVDENSYRVATNDIESAALQRKARACEIADRRREIQLASEPRLDRVLIGGDDILEMSWLKRPEM